MEENKSKLERIAEEYVRDCLSRRADGAVMLVANMIRFRGMRYYINWCVKIYRAHLVYMDSQKTHEQKG